MSAFFQFPPHSTVSLNLLWYFCSLQDPEFQVWFLVEIYEVGDGAAINQSARFANVTMLESDDPQGLVYFAIGSRLPVATLRANRVTLQVYREGSVASAISVKYRLQVKCTDRLYIYSNKNSQGEKFYCYTNIHTADEE